MLYLLSVFITLTGVCRTAAQPIDTTGCYAMPLMPIEVCHVESVGVDTTEERVRLTWHVNSSEGVAGYCICSGSPCLALDTLWSVYDTTYLCTTHSPDELHTYCIFAIDSCLHGGELTDAVSNMVLRIVTDSCIRTLQCDWSAVTIETPEPLYVVWMQTDEGLLLDTVVGELSYQTELPNSTMHLKVRVAALGDGGVTVWSNAVTADFQPTDSCVSDPHQHKIPSNPYVPNCFTPMLSVNNCFAPRFASESIPDEYHLNIFNRIGALVYQSHEVSACWDGTHEGRVLPQGVYVYYLIYRVADEVRRLSGTVLLLH